MILSLVLSFILPFQLFTADAVTQEAHYLRSAVVSCDFPRGEGRVEIALPGRGTVRRVNDSEIEGYGLIEVNGRLCPRYFVLRLDMMPSSRGYIAGGKEISAYSRELPGEGVGYFFNLVAKKVNLQIGVSYVSCANARENIKDRELPQQVLIEVEGGAQEDRDKLQELLAKAHACPFVISDINGEYPLMEYGNPASTPGLKIPTGPYGQELRKLRESGVWRQEAGKRYSGLSTKQDYSFYRFFLPEIYADMVSSMKMMEQEWGSLPVNELYAVETGEEPASHPGTEILSMLGIQCTEGGVLFSKGVFSKAVITCPDGRVITIMGTKKKQPKVYLDGVRVKGPLPLPRSL